MPRVTEEHKEAMRVKIRDAALICFSRKGFARTSMAEIIAESGLSAGAIYTYYPSKEELLASVAESILIERSGRFLHHRSDHPEPPAKQLIALVESIPPELLEGAMVQVWGEIPTSPQLRPLTDRIRGEIGSAFRAYLTAWFTDGRGMPVADAQRRAATLAPVFIGLVQGYIVSRTFWGVDAAREYTDGLRELLEDL